MRRSPAVRLLPFATLVCTVLSGCATYDDPVDVDGVEPGTTLEIVGDSEPVAVVESSADLAVRVRTPDGTPLEGARVFWTVEEGEAELTGGNPTLSGPDGVARQTVQVGAIPGIIVVRATLDSSAGDPGVVFRVQVRAR